MVIHDQYKGVSNTEEVWLRGISLY